MTSGYRFQGFTLIEMLISISIFMLFISLMAGSYTALVSANRKAQEEQKLYREVRFIFDTFGQEIRAGRLDYSYLENTNLQKQKIISILRENSLQRTIFKFSEKNLFISKESRLDTNSPWTLLVNWEPLTSTTLSLEDLSFSVFPLKDPYDSRHAEENEIQWQPTVSIDAKVAQHDFHTTYASRHYGS